MNLKKSMKNTITSHNSNLTGNSTFSETADNSRKIKNPIPQNSKKSQKRNFEPQAIENLNSEKITIEMFEEFLEKIFPDIDKMDFPDVQKVDENLLEEILKEAEIFFKKNEKISFNERIAGCFVEDFCHDKSAGKNGVDQTKSMVGKDFNIEVSMASNSEYESHEDTGETIIDEVKFGSSGIDELGGNIMLKAIDTKTDNVDSNNNDDFDIEKNSPIDSNSDDSQDYEDSAIDSDDSSFNRNESNLSSTTTKDDDFNGDMNANPAKRRKTKPRIIKIGSFHASIDKKYTNDIVVYDICDDLEFFGTVNTYESGYALLNERIELLKRQNAINIQRIELIDKTRFKAYASMCILNTINMKIQDFYIKKLKGKKKKRSKHNVNELLKMARERSEFKKLFDEILEFKFEDFKDLFLTDNVKVDVEFEDYF